ncbi:MAG: hypothetical protein AB7F86_05810 [Bdellovibrionales bacterium]
MNVVLAMLLGVWQYDGFFFDGHRYPNPNPEFELTFTFTETESRLKWHREDPTQFCERTASYTLENSVLTQTVTWLNPDNESSCSQDPDMQMGRTTSSPIRFAGEELQLVLSLDGKEFLYILKRPASSSILPGSF